MDRHHGFCLTFFQTILIISQSSESNTLKLSIPSDMLAMMHVDVAVAQATASQTNGTAKGTVVLVSSADTFHTHFELMTL